MTLSTQPRRSRRLFDAGLLTTVTTGMAIFYASMTPAVLYALVYVTLVTAGGAVSRWAWRSDPNPG